MTLLIFPRYNLDVLRLGRAAREQARQYHHGKPLRWMSHDNFLLAPLTAEPPRGDITYKPTGRNCKRRAGSSVQARVDAQ
jgi:hypothetical protein